MTAQGISEILLCQLNRWRDPPSCIFTVTLIRKAMYKNLASICSQEGILANSRIMFLFVLGEAYQVLSDPTQRQAYGAYGKSGISTEFVPQKSSVYVSQYDVHMPEMTVRETVDFSARCQGVGSRTDIMVELSRRENEAGVMPDQEVDAYMKAISEGSTNGDQTSSFLQTERLLLLPSLGLCNPSHYSKDSSLSSRIFGLDLTYLLCHWIQPGSWEVAPP